MTDHGTTDRGTEDRGRAAGGGREVRLQVNVDHVATVRQARRSPYPDPVEVARIAEEAGAGGITVHLRGDRRHIQDEDVRRLRGSVRGRLNLEMAATEEMLGFALEIAPHQVSLVPERPEEVTTEGGLDLVNRAEEVREAAGRLAAGGIEVSLFLDPEPPQLDALSRFPEGLVRGFEINTDAYARAALETAAGTAPGASPRADAELARIAEMARRGGALGLAVYAGHGLTTANVGPVTAVPEIEELNIGHWLVSRALAVGMAEAVRKMLAAMGR